METIKLTNDIWNQVKFTRLNATYESVYNLAKMFYYNSVPNLNKGDELTFSFLVPLNKLFENYLFQLLRKNVNGNKKVEHEGPIEYLGNMSGKDCMQLKPDISINYSKS